MLTFVLKKNLMEKGMKEKVFCLGLGYE